MIFFVRYIHFSMSTTARHFYLYNKLNCGYWSGCIFTARNNDYIRTRAHEICFILSLRSTENAEFKQEILLEEKDDGYR